MKSFLAFLSSLFILPFNNFGGIRPTPTPITFHQYPQSSISVNWGALGPDYTIFMEDDNKPCDVVEHSIQITNHKTTNRPITIRGKKTAEEKNFSQVLEIKIYKDDVLIYGPKTLKQFFTESAGASGVSLGNLAGNSTSTYKFRVEFPCSAGNEYQKAKLVFKLKIGKLLKLPSPCPCSCYQHQGGKFNLGRNDRFVFADFDEGESVKCPNQSKCAIIN